MAYVNSYSYIKLNIIVISFHFNFHICIQFLKKRNTKLKNIYYKGIVLFCFC